jgi:glycosyltransferase involved in cell wall biosynthesis
MAESIMPNKLIYISNTRLPSEKANSYQIMQMCNSFSMCFDVVELWTGKARNSKDFAEIENVYRYYNIPESFALKKFFQFDSKFLFLISEFIWANFRNLVFSLNVSFHLIKHRKSKNVFIYTRVWLLLYVLLFFKKIRLIDNKIFYESHKFSSFLMGPLLKIDGVIVINNYLKGLYLERNLTSVLLAHDGVNIDEYKEISSYQFNSYKKKYIVLYTGSLFSWKGVHIIVDALRYLPDEIELVCIGGSGNYLKDFKKYVEKSNNSDRILVIPHISKAELIDYVENSDVLVLPNSVKDKMNLYTSPIKLFEYMASKRPIVASNISAIKEILNHNENAFLFESDNPKDLALKIKNAINYDCKKMVDNAYIQATKYTWNNRAETIASFICKL